MTTQEIKAILNAARTAGLNYLSSQRRYKFREDVRKRKHLEYDADAIAIETVLRIRKFRFDRRRK